MLASRIALGAAPLGPARFVVANARALHTAGRFPIGCAFPLRSKFRPSQSFAIRPSLPGSHRYKSSTAAAATAEIAPDFSDDIVGAVADTASRVSPDSMGYLKSLGLDFGFGPSSLIQAYLDAVHVFSGTPWWATIILSVVIMRVGMFPFYCKMSSVSAQIKELTPLTTPLQKKMRMYQLKGDQQSMLRARREMMELYQKAGVKRRWLAFPFTQIPIFYCFYRNLKEMSELPVPEFIYQGAAWFPDLSLMDPYLILPVLSSGLIAVQFRLGGEGGNQNAVTNNMKAFLVFVVPLASLGITYCWPAGLTLYVATSSAIGLIQTLILRNHRFRERAGLYPLSSNPTPNPLSNSINSLNVAKGALPKKEEGPKQIGGQGSFLDKLTGGDNKGKTGGLSSWQENSAERKKARQYEAYEKQRAKRLEEERKELELMREKKRQMIAQNSG